MSLCLGNPPRPVYPRYVSDGDGGWSGLGSVLCVEETEVEEFMVHPCSFRERSNDLTQSVRTVCSGIYGQQKEVERGKD